IQGQEGVDPNKILESDLLRLLFMAETGRERLFSIAKANLLPSHLRVGVCQRLYAIFMETYEKGDSTDLLSCASSLEQEDDSQIVLAIMSRKIQMEKAEESLLNTIKRILERNWMEERETIKLKIHSGKLDEDEALELAKQFDILKRQVPE